MSFAEDWERKTFPVQAVQVTEENITKVANWCDGRIYGRQDTGYPLRLYVQFDAVGYSKHYGAKAVVGDWIIRVDNHFKHFTDRQFKMAYRRKIDRTQQVREIMERALSVNLEIAHKSPDELADAYTQMVIKLYEGEK